MKYNGFEVRVNSNSGILYHVHCVSFIGDEVFVIGYAVFGEEHDLQPTVTSGVVSKVLRIGETPVMLQVLVFAL